MMTVFITIGAIIAGGLIALLILRKKHRDD